MRMGMGTRTGSSFVLLLLGMALSLLVVLVVLEVPGRADVTGSFRLDVGFSPIDCRFWFLSDPDAGGFEPLSDQPCEGTIFRFDVQTDAGVFVTVSGLTAGFHVHIGTTGFEDALISLSMSLGALDLAGTLVFAQPFADGLLPTGQRVPLCLEEEIGSGSCPLLFVKKRLELTLSLGGLTWENLALFEDVNFPDYCQDFFVGSLEVSYYDLFGCVPPLKGVDTSLTYGAQSQQFGFGDVIALEGQTPSGITVRATTGICAEQLVNAIKKHVWRYTVNRDCYGGVQTPSVKPPMVFSFETLSLEGIPLAAGLRADVRIRCGSLAGSAEAGAFFACAFEGVGTITGGPLFDTVTITLGTFSPLGAGMLSDLEVQAAGGPVTLQMRISPSTLLPTFVLFTATFPVNPDTNPAELRLQLRGDPSLIGVDGRLRLWRAGLRLQIDLSYDIDPLTRTLDFDRLAVGAEAAAGVIGFDAEVILLETGTDPEGAFLVGGALGLTVRF